MQIVKNNASDIAKGRSERWNEMARDRSRIAQDKDDFHLFTAKFDGWVYAFLFLVIAFFVAAFFAIIGGK